MTKPLSLFEVIKRIGVASASSLAIMKSSAETSFCCDLIVESEASSRKEAVDEQDDDEEYIGLNFRPGSSFDSVDGMTDLFLMPGFETFCRGCCFNDNSKFPSLTV